MKSTSERILGNGKPSISVYPKEMLNIGLRKCVRALKSLVVPVLALGFVFAIGFAGLAQPSPSVSHAVSPAPKGQATSAPTVDDVIDMVLDRNPGLRSYGAHATLNVRQLNFPWLSPVLEGKVYYTKPGYEVYDFPHTPSYLQGITKVEGAVGLANRWRHCYDITLETRPDSYVLHMVPKILGEVAQMDVSIDKKSGEERFFNWSYHRETDSVQLWQTYSNVGGYDVVTSQAADITKHLIRAKATGTFDAFHFNVPVPTPTATPSNPLHQCDN